MRHLKISTNTRNETPAGYPCLVHHGLSRAVRHEIFIDLDLPFEFKLLRSEMYVAPPELWILGAALSYKHRAPTELKASDRCEFSSVWLVSRSPGRIYEPSESNFRCRCRPQLCATANHETDWREPLVG